MNEILNLILVSNTTLRVLVAFSVLLAKQETFSTYLDVFTMHLVPFIIRTNEGITHTHTNNILYTVSIPTCFNASASSSGSLRLLEDDADASKHLGVLKRYTKFC